MGNIFDRHQSATSIAMVEGKLTKFENGIIDLIYPVGSYYYTSDTEFNPNKKWGGKWEYADSRWHRTK